MRFILAAVSLTVGAMCAVPAAQARQQQPPDEVATSRGEAALAEAREAMAAGRWQTAADKYAEALTYLPDNQEAVRGQADALAMLQRASTSESVVRERELLRQRTLAEFEESYSRASERAKQGDYDTAHNEMITAKSRLDLRRDYLSAAEYNRLSARANELIDQINKAREVQRLRDEAIARAAAVTAQQLEAERQRQERRRIIDENLRRVRQLQLELKYPEALQVVDQILFIDELNPSALALRDVLTSAMQYRNYADLQRQKELGFAQTSTDIQWSSIIPRPNPTGPGSRSLSGIYEYPDDWPNVTFRRSGAGGYEESATDRAVRQRLTANTMPVDFNRNSFEQVMSFLKNVTGLNFYVDYRALQEAGIDREAEVTLNLQDVSPATVLERVLEQLGEGGSKPQFVIQDGVITVSSEDALRKRTILLVYDIRDLLMQVPMFDNAPELDLNTALGQGQNQGGGGGGGGGGAAGGGGGGGGFGGGGGGGTGGGGSIFQGGGTDPERLTREELVKQITDIIQENVDPEGWRDLGGSTGSLQELNGNLIITNTINNHRAIHGLLAQLREIRALQINVESRFLTVSNDWFEKIGVDLDLYFNTNSAMFNAAKAADPNFHLSDFFNPDGSLRDPVVFGAPAQVLDPAHPANVVPTGSYFGVPGTQPGDNFQNIEYPVFPVGSPIRNQGGWSPIGFNQQHASLIDSLANFGATSFAGIATANPALAVGLQFLDDVQVDLLIEATQADRRSVVLTAPRLTFFNGQRAWVAVTTQQAFVSALTAVTGDAAGAFQPTIGRIADGFVLDVEGVISADRRYVTMTVIFDFAEFLGFRTSSAAEFSGAAGGGGIGGGSATEFTGFVELPTLRVSQVRTTVSVPDKGTVLLGGQRSTTEVEVEAGIPVLSKIPFVNRFFTNRVTSKEERTLLILIRPEIIIQQENEDLLFPGLADSVGAGAYLR